ncbi:hypothetical protein CBR_g4352 [Chara braunii]|uniref:Uncharacterized protein n=1 Tax=Chara braunii TaxID=69332 RepID=A0A388KHL5_CHABU|nr:hypothetical protein CBR_g4352 [Chara braunii]|eukprot:GBG69516.1 hypothetical protein CBR_g4352 [Chara braunii]
MSGRGRGKASGRRGRWSNCRRYWMEGNNANPGGQTAANSVQYSGGNPATNVYPPGVNPTQFPSTFHAPPPVMPVIGQTTGSSMAPPAPAQYQTVAPVVNPWMMPPWQNASQWPVNGQWVGQPPIPPPASNQQHSNQVQPLNQQAVVPHNPGNGHDTGKGPAANAFPGLGNRAYFTKEYMDILEDIKMSKAVEEARKKIASGRRGGLQNQDSPDEGSRSEVRSADKARSADRSEEMKAWVMATLGDSQQDQVMLEKDRGIIRRREGGTVKQNLQPRMESSNELADIKLMLVALLQGISDAKGKAPVILPKPVKEEASPKSEGHDDVDIAQNEPNDEEDEDDEGGLAAYMKLRQEFYSSLHYTRVQELCKQKNIQYFRKDAGAWELARLDLQEYANLLKEEKPARGAESSRPTTSRSNGTADKDPDLDNSVKGN